MKKNYLFLLALIASMFAFTGCSDDDENQFDYYAHAEEDLTKEGHDLVGDVKILEIIDYNDAEWKNDKLELNKAASKDVYEFAQNGMVTTLSEYRYNGDETVLTEVNSYSYDDKYRVVGVISKDYEDGKLSTTSRTFAKYDEAAKTATIYVYKGTEDKLEADEKTVVDLNEYGLIDESNQYYYDALTPGTKLRAAESKVTYTENIKDIHSKDAKGNIVLSYSLYTTKEGDNESVTKLVSKYLEVRNITYYDGTVSSNKNTEEVKESATFVAGRSYFEGSVKSHTGLSYYNAEWNITTNSIKEGDLSYKYVNFYSKEGYNTGNELYSMNDDKLVLTSRTSITKDNKDRITETKEESIDAEGKVERIYKTVITYSETNATVLSYSYTGTEQGEPTSKTVYGLTKDGFANEYAKESHELLQPALRTALADAPNDKDFEGKPSSSDHFIEEKDDRGNVIKTYELNKEYDKDGKLTDAEVYSYRKSEFVYY